MTTILVAFLAFSFLLIIVPLAVLLDFLYHHRMENGKMAVVRRIIFTTTLAKCTFFALLAGGAAAVSILGMSPLNPFYLLLLCVSSSWLCAEDWMALREIVKLQRNP